MDVDPKPRSRRAVRRVLAWTGGVVLALLLLLVLGVAALQTASAKRWLAARLSDLASGATGYVVTVTTIEGTLPTNFSVGSVEMADAEGVWLRAQDLRLEWRPLALLDGRLAIARLTLAGLAVEREPIAAAAAAPEAEPGLPSLELPRLPLEVSVADLEIGEIRLGAPLLGEEIVAAAFGSAALGGAPDAAEAALTVMRLDGRPGRFEILLTQTPRRDLILEATAEEPAGGIVAGLLDLPGRPPIELRLAGNGPLTGWTGRLDATAGEAAAGLDLTLALDHRVALGLAGTVDPGDLAGPALRDLVPSPIGVDAALTWAPGAALAIDHASLSAPGLDLRLAGEIDPEADSIAATGELAATDPDLIARWADPVRADALRASATASGLLQAPRLEIAASVERLAAPGASARSVDVEASLTPTDDRRRLALTARLVPQGLALDVDPALAAPLGAAPTMTLDGSVDVTDGRLDIAGFELAGAALHVTGAGHVAEAGRDLDLGATLRLDDVAPLGQLAGQVMGGALTADLRVVGDATAPTLAIDLEARGNGMALGDPLLARVVGAAPHLVAAATLDGGTIRIERADLTAAALTAQARGTIGDSLDLGLDAAVPDVAVLSAALGPDLAGALTMTARLTGSPGNPEIDARLNGRRTAVAGIALGDPTAAVSVTDIAGTPAGDLTLTATPGGRAVAASTAFRLTDAGAVRLSGLDLSGDGGLRLAGDLVIRPDGLIEGSVDGEVADLAAWQALAGMALGGAVELRVSAAAGKGQRIELVATGHDLALADAATIGAVRLEGDVEDALAAPALDLRLSADGVAAGGIAFDTLAATAQGGLADMAWTLAAANADENDARLDARGRLALNGSSGTVTLADLTAALPPVEAALAQPATIAWDPAGVTLDRLEATLGDGRLSLAGRFAPEAMALDAAASDLPIGPLAALAGGVGLDGRLSGEVELAGDPAAPEGRASLTLSDLRQAGIDPAEAVALSGAADAALVGGRIDATARLTGPTDFAVDARISAPVAGAGALEGKITGGVDLALLPQILDLRGDALSGRLDLDLALGGTVAAPRADGRAVVSNGDYESAEAGTVLRNLALEVVGDNDRLRLVSLSADDGSGGRLSATGTLAIDGAAGFPLNLTVVQERFTALRRADATLQASGTLDIARAAGGGRIAGEITIDTAELRIPEQLGGGIVTLEVTEINLPPGQQRHTPPPAPSAALLDLAIAVDVPGRAFLRGRGLDSEWRGQLQVAGTTAAPDITGSLNVVRGTLDLFGRIFRFNEGRVTFVGGGEIDPELAFTARSEAAALTVEAAVSGTASAPVFALSSDPPLPQDEILARLLFGSSTGSLTPVQAVQLAQTAAQLSGRGSPVSMLDELRQGFGLDMLGVESGETVGASSLAIGKYITDDVFLKMNQGLTPESRQVGVEVRVLPRVTVESSVGAQSQGNVGVNWRLDY